MEAFSYYLSQEGKIERKEKEREGEEGGKKEEKEKASLVLGVVRGKRGYGTESIVVVAPFDFRGEGGEGEVVKGGGKGRRGGVVGNEFLFVVSILRNLVTANWLNKGLFYFLIIISIFYLSLFIF